MKIAKRFEDLPPYTPIEPFEILSKKLGIPIDKIIKLDANENPYGPSPKTLKALSNLAFPHIYPDPESRLLRAALAEFTGLSEDYLLAGSGADELIDLLLRVILDPGDVVINCPPTFGMYSFDTLINAGKLIEIPRDTNFKLDLERIVESIKKQQPKVIFLTSPNNPDGHLITREVVDALLDYQILVVLDEAYIEFAGNDKDLGRSHSLIKEVEKRDNLIVMRTFSKWAGLAGLRVGYGAFPEWLLPVLWKAKQPYNVNVAASAAAIASLEDKEYLNDNIRKIKSERSRLLNELGKFSFLESYSSQANFILCKISTLDASDLKTALSQKGILVRHYNTPLLKNYIRISVGKEQQTNQLIEVLDQIAQERNLL